MTSLKTGIHHSCWEHISQGLEKEKKKDKQPLAYFPWLVIEMPWQWMFQPLKCLEDLEPKHWNSNSRDWEDFLIYLFILF